MKWSKLYNTAFFVDSATQMMKNNLQYHNLLHVEQMFDFLHENNVAYDADLDAAVIAHDVIYDCQPNKEERSARWVRDKWLHNTDFLTRYGVDVGRVKNLIMATGGHKLTQDNEWILKADLHGLASPLTAIQNFVWINQENVEIYNCTQQEAAMGTIKFMTQFRHTMLDNYEISHGDVFWSDVIKGVDNTIDLANMVIDK